ncbi:hypothetical protein [Kitasatospora purpeofusca]|uniref:hypothetical protein n=1 Tax=Kitasatospora purpeofusca TaxID=67352 RepID=UPI002A5A3355|nr:hypothetical protein [Kitasatospora purpeofusca]MDY0815180.1 hypothetical protein [Kitasatospora purpeofusca]
MRTLLLGVVTASALVLATPTFAAAAPASAPAADGTSAPASARAADGTSAPGSAPGSAPAFSGTGRSSASLHGWARLDLFGPVPEPSQLITLAVDAHATGRPSTGGRGHATIQHVFDRDTDREFTARAEIRVDCLTERDGTVVLTGSVDSVTYTAGPALDPVPPFPGDWHPEVALGLRHDEQGRLRVGWSGVPAQPTAPPVATACQAPTDAGLHLVRGGFAFRR